MNEGLVELAQVKEKYKQLCDLETQVESANLRISEIVKGLWKPEL